MSPAEIVQREFDESVPILLQKDLLNSVLVKYHEADKFAKKYPWQEAQVVRGHIRRAEIEVDIRNVAVKYFSSGASASAEPNTNRSAYHSLLQIGTVNLTQSRLRNENEMV